MSNHRYEPVLAHHGIKGMHWGIRRDKTSESSQRKTSKARYTPEELAKREKAKKYVKVGAAAAASVLAAYGAKKIHDRYFTKTIKVAQKIPYDEIVGYRPGKAFGQTHMYPIFETRFREQIVDIPNPHRITFGLKK